MDEPILHRYLIKCWYWGTNFNGSQRQPHKRTVEGELITALKKTHYIHDFANTDFKASIRTDAGVHARAAVFGFTTMKEFHIVELNCQLPNDMGVWAWTEVPLDFQPRFEPLWKQYFYIYVKDPEEQLDLLKMQAAAIHLHGTQNFSLLSKKNPSKPLAQNTISIHEITIEQKSDLILFSFKANSFLWQLIRRSVNLLLSIGRGERTIQDIHALFAEENIGDDKFKKIGPERPEGLILWHVEFPASILFTEDRKCKQMMDTNLREVYKTYYIQTRAIEFWQEQNSEKK